MQRSLSPETDSMYLNHVRLTSAAQPLRKLLAEMRGVAPMSDYRRGYVAALEFTLNLLDITEPEAL